ncbi:hypothetical protein CgunFtcFv8_000319 [Champsocephalus gunnari]|uniref:Myb/SANT-like DNA-binding domain-containing protein n=1 Tax=Champsocephalus gunnari TaxID=52237 RepID=A0AAN8DJH5_CHAGU|nr:hypothetical protein CgunFtcFv8_000319 [Champsocephalus gunnari]
MAGAKHTWTEEHTLTLIKVRSENDQLFTGRRHTAKKAWEEILKALGLCGLVTPTQIGKKWDNLKRKYKAIGGRPSIDPPTLMDSATAAVASGSGSTSTEAVQSQVTVEDEEAAKSGSDKQEDVEPSTSAAPPPRKKNANHSCCSSWRRPRRRTASTASKETSKRFLELFEELVRKE